MLHVERRGEGPDLALIHGWAMHGGVWRGVADELARDFRLHVVDLPGHGRSAPLAGATLESVAAAVAEVLPSRAAVCGWSLGAQVAMRIALDHSARVSRLILVSGTPRFVREGDWPFGVGREVLEDFGQDLEMNYEGTLKRFLALQARGSDRARELIQVLRAGLFERGRPGLEALKAGLRILLATDLRNDVLRIAQPTLLIHGERDLLTPPAAGRWLSENLGDAQIALLTHCAHAPFLSDPGTFTESVREFIPHG